MDIEKISDFIKILPSIIMYIVPGYIYIQIYNYVFNLKVKEIKSYLYEYIIASFIINNISNIALGIINYKFNKNYEISEANVQLTICCCTLFFGYLTARLLKCHFWNVIMGCLDINRNNMPNIFADMIDYDGSTFVSAYLPSEKLRYDGYLLKFHYNGSYNESFITLCEYTVCKYGLSEVDDNNLNYYKSCEGERKREYIYLKISQIDRLEVIYSDGSKKLIKKSEKRTKFKDKIKKMHSDFCTEYELISNNKKMSNSAKMWILLWGYMIYIVLINLFLVK